MPILTFYLRPERRSRNYFRVYIFPDKPTMLAFYDGQCRLSPSIGRHRRGKSFEAQVNGWGASYRKGKRTKCRGQILLHLGYIGAGVVSHEMTHAARYYLYRCKSLPDERMARIVGRLTAAFWRHWYQLQEDGILVRS